MQPTTAASIQIALQAVRSRCGDNAVFVARDAAMRRPWLAPPLELEHAREHPELASLVSSLRRGQMIEVSGPPGSGKTSLALALLALLMPPHALAAYVDSPRTFYPPSAAASGVDLRRLWVVRLLGRDATLAAVEQLLKSGVMDVVLWDMVGDRQALTGSQLRRLQLAAASQHATLLLLTKQPRRPPYRALDSGATLRLVVRRQDWHWQQLGTERQCDGYTVCVELARVPGKAPARPVVLPLGQGEPAFQGSSQILTGVQLAAPDRMLP